MPGIRLPRRQGRDQRRGLLAALIVAASCGLGRAGVAQPSVDPVAVVTDIEGAASLHREGRTRTLAVLDTVGPADQLRLAANARLELAFTAGQGRVYSLAGPGRFFLRGDGVVGLDPGSSIALRDLAGTWRTLRIGPGLVGRASVSLRGVPARQLVVRSPVGPQLARSLDALRWERPYDRCSARCNYAVRIIDSQGRVVFSAETQDTSAPLPLDWPWARDATYLWAVAATAPDGRHADGAAEFRVLSPTAEKDIVTLEQVVAQARKVAHSADAIAEDVLLAMALDQAGLRDEADRKWRALARTRPAFASRTSIRP